MLLHVHYAGGRSGKGTPNMRMKYDFSRGKRGAVIPSPGKTRITIALDDDVIEAFRAKAEAAGRGYQAMINEALRVSLQEDERQQKAELDRRLSNYDTDRNRGQLAGDVLSDLRRRLRRRGVPPR